MLTPESKRELFFSAREVPHYNTIITIGGGKNKYTTLTGTIRNV